MTPQTTKCYNCNMRLQNHWTSICLEHKYMRKFDTVTILVQSQFNSKYYPHGGLPATTSASCNVLAITTLSSSLWSLACRSFCTAVCRHRRCIRPKTRRVNARVPGARAPDGACPGVFIICSRSTAITSCRSTNAVSSVKRQK